MADERTMVARFPCPVCGYLTFDEEPPGTYDVCAVCFWEDDEIQFRDPDYAGGANEVSLSDARKNFEAFAASSESVRSKVRPPRAEEVPAANQ